MSEKKANMEVKPRKISDYFKILGPGVIISAIVIGPGSVTTLSSMGAAYSYSTIWLVVVSCIASYFYQEGANRIVINKGDTVLGAIQKNISPTVSKIMFVLVYLMTLFYQAGNFIGAGMAMNYLIPQLSIIAWAVVLIIVALVAVFLKKDHLLDGFTKFLVMMMVIAFLITAFASNPDWGQVVSEGFSFRIPGGNWGMALALMGTTITTDIPLALSVLNKERYSTKCGELYEYTNKEKTKCAKIDLVSSLIITALISSAVMICSATVLYPKGITVSSAGDMAMQLTPFLGKFAGVLFSVGLWAAAFSSGAYRIKLMAQYYGDAFAKESDEGVTEKKVLQLLAGLIPLVVLLIFNGNPVQLILIAQTASGILLPVITIALGFLLNKKSYMKEHTNTVFQNIAFVLMAALTLSLAVRTFISIFS